MIDERADKATARTAGRPPGAGGRTLYLVKRMQSLAYERMESALKSCGVTPTQYSVLSVLGHRDKLSSAQLSRRFAVKPQSMFKLIAALERNGLVSRVDSVGDRRMLHVRLTPAGRKALDACEIVVDKVEADLLHSLSGDDIRAFRRLMQSVLGGAQGEDV